MLMPFMNRRHPSMASLSPPPKQVMMSSNQKDIPYSDSRTGLISTITPTTSLIFAEEYISMYTLSQQAQLFKTHIGPIAFGHFKTLMCPIST